MRHEAWTAGSFVRVLRHKPLLGGAVVAILLAGALCTAVGTVSGLANYRDVGYPDSATLLRIGEFVRSGHIYSDIDRPPYQVTCYGPLTYVLLAVPYRVAQAVGITPQVLVRLGVVGTLCVCVSLIFLISQRLYSSRSMAWLCALFAVSALPLASWTTQIRSDFLALAFSLLGLYLFLLWNGRRRAIGAAICAGIALLIKQTFFAEPIAIVGWLIYKRRYKDAALWTAGVALTVAGGYAIALWREPLMLKHIAALRHPVLEYRQALKIIWDALSQPVVPFALIGGLLALWKRTPERVLLLTYCIVAWLVAILTISQVGGYLNYFWEALLVSSVLAGPGLCELQRKVNRTPILVTAMLLFLLLGAFWPTLLLEIRYLRMSYANASDYQVHKAKWESFVSAVSGKRLLSTLPDVTVLSATPEIPDPYLNSTLERGGQWNPGPVVSQINAGTFDLVVVMKGEAENHDVRSFRGVRAWDDALWGALKGTYKPACVFEQMEVWLPNRGSGGIFPGLSQMGCRIEPEHTDGGSAHR